MKKNKFILSLFVLLVCIFTINAVSAVQVIDSNAIDGVYKASNDSSNFKLPFVRVANGRIDLDKELAQMGMLLSNSSVDINAMVTQPQLILSNDSVRINSDMEDVLVICTGNVILDANVENMIAISAGGIVVEENGNATKNLVVCTPDLKVNGKIDGNLLGTVDNVVLNSVVAGETRLTATEINFGDDASLLSGIQVNTTNANLKIPERVGESQIEVVESEDAVKVFSIKDYLKELIFAIIGDLVAFALVLLFVKKERVEKMAAKVTSSNVIKNGLLSYLVVLGCIIFGFTLLFLLPRVGGAALTVGIAAMTIFTLLKNLIVGTFIAQLATDKYKDTSMKPNLILTAVTSFLMIEIVETIPVVGGLVKFVLFVVALGIATSLVCKKEENKPEVVTEVVEDKE